MIKIKKKHSLTVLVPDSMPSMGQIELFNL